MENKMKKCLREEGSTHKPAADIISLVFKTANWPNDFHW